MKKRLVLLCLALLLGVLLCACEAESAYDIAVKNGFVGTEQEWLASLQGAQGAPGEKGEDGAAAEGGALDAENPQGLDFYLLPDGTYSVSVGKALFAEEITVPATYRGKAVTCVGSPFLDANYVFDAYVYSGPNGFSDAPNLKKITLPDGITKIGYNAFYRCKKLAGISIPASVTEVGVQAFSGCSALTRVDFSESSQLTAIGVNAFVGCTSLRSFTVPKNVTDIGNNAFVNCISLLEIYNLSALKIILGGSGHGFIASYAMDVHTDTNIPSNLFTTNDGYVFYDGDTVNYLIAYEGTATDLTLPADCRGEDYEIYQDAFGGTDITSVTLPSSVTAIGTDAFNSCDSLLQVNFTEGSRLTEFPDGTFQSCTALKQITVPASVERIGEYTFASCRSLASFKFEDNSQLKKIERVAFESCTALTSFTIPAGVTEINHSAFYKSRVYEIYNLSALEISVNTMWDIAHTIEIHTNTNTPSKLYTTDDGYVFYDGDTVNYLLGYYGTDTDLVLPADCKGESYEIYKQAFSTDTGSTLTSITIPAAVTVIGEEAFANCSHLAAVYFESNSCLTTIGVRAFWECATLSDFTIPASVTTIGNSAFTWCGIKSIAIPVGVTSIGPNAFFNCENLSEVTFEATAGWSVCRYDAYEFEENPTYTPISADDLANAAKAAEYLTEHYSNHYWKRS